jgi:beta-lactamase class A
MIDRRQFSSATAATLVAGWLATKPSAARAADPRQVWTEQIRRLEVASGGRLGVAVIDTGDGSRLGYRNTELFPMCSTFKALVAGAVLKKVDAGTEQLSRRIVFAAADVISGSAVTRSRAGGDGMTVAELCEAAITQSDNTAANLLLVSLGGPAAVTAFARTLGDQVTRLDRNEPSLNEAIPGDPRDTSSPDAMASDLQAMVLGKALTPASRDQLAAWLVANKTEDARLRAGLPKDWRVGDKTGTGERGSANDIAVIWPPGRAPLVIVAYLTNTSTTRDQQSATIAAVAKTIAELYAK